ncbi:MAG: 5'/3'-nucleotidase SurE [Planctomycetes bacterium]|nr:5'/3'-nucleotidase SurE [Planctomycetota bacterium]
MRILLTNDDGIDAPGIQALRTALRRLGEVIIVAPDRQQSATGCSISLHRPITVHARDEVTFSVDGTPADAVKLAMRALLRKPPDIVVSGMNFGLNCGNNVLYSGTLAGALEGAQHGYPAYAVSLEVSDRPRWRPAATAAVRLIERLHRARRDDGVVYNINIPAAKIRGVVAARQEMQPYLDSFDRRTDPRGRVYYWYHGMKDWELSETNGEAPTDQRAVQSGYIAVTPLHRDLTRHDLMPDLSLLTKTNRRKGGRA